MEDKNHVSTANSTASKRRKLSREHLEGDAQVIASVSNQDPTTMELLKLPIELFQFIFNYLSLKDLVAIGETCKYLNKVAGKHFQLNYPGLKVSFRRDGIFTSFPRIKLNFFTPFIQYISISDTSELSLFLSNYSKFHQLRVIRLYSIDFSTVEFEGLKLMDMRRVLDQVDYLRIDRCESILKAGIFLDLFPNLNRLALRVNSLGIREEIEWVLKKYPLLKRLEFTSSRLIPELATILGSNTNIRDLQMPTSFLWKNRHSFRRITKVSIDELSISFDSLGGNAGLYRASVVKLFKILNELQANGFYKQLRINLPFLKVSKFIVRELEQFKSLISLYSLCDVVPAVALSSLNNLREIRFNDANDIKNLDVLAIHLEKLELIHFFIGKITDLMPFLRQSKKLKKIKIENLRHSDHLNECRKAIALSVLNKERSKLKNATKIILYVAEHVYLTTKAIYETNLEFITLTHLNSYRWDHEFDLDYSAFEARAYTKEKCIQNIVF